MSSSFIKKALVVVDVEDGHTHVEIEYLRFVDNDKGYRKFVDYYLTEPIGDWVQITFDKSTLPYENFLSTMVKQTLEVKRRLAGIALENILVETPDFHTKIRVLHTSKILETAFIPPFINADSSWQVNLLNDLCSDYLPDMIERCDHSKRLIKLFNVLKRIQQGE